MPKGNGLQMCSVRFLLFTVFPTLSPSLCVRSSAVEPPTELDEISVLRVHGRGLWVGTRTGFILLLDRDKVERGEPPLLGLQKCGEGRVSDICPLFADKQLTARLRVMCSLEHSNETTGLVMTWEYHRHLDGVRMESMKRPSSCQSTSSTSSSDGRDRHTSTPAQIYASTARKAEKWDGGVVFEASHGDQADDLTGQTGGNHGEYTKSIDSAAQVNSDAITGCHGDAVTLTVTGDHNNITTELNKDDVLIQQFAKAEPHNPFTCSPQSDTTGGNDAAPVAEGNVQSGETDSSTWMAAPRPQQLSNSTGTEASDVAAGKDQPFLPLPESGETSLLGCSDDCSSNDMEERLPSGGRREECSVGSWVVVADPPASPPGGGACTREGEHDRTEDKGGATSSADGSTLVDLAVGEAQEGRINDPESYPPHQEFSRSDDTAVVNEVVDPDVESGSQSDLPDHPSEAS